MERCRVPKTFQVRHPDAGKKENVAIHGGEEYAVYASQDVLGEVGETYGRLLDAVAVWCGVRRDDVLRVTEAFERRLVRGLERGREGATRHSDDED